MNSRWSSLNVAISCMMNGWSISAKIVFSDMICSCWLYWITLAFEMIFMAKTRLDVLSLTSFTFPNVPTPNNRCSSKSAMLTTSVARCSTSAMGPMHSMKVRWSRKAQWHVFELTTASNSRGTPYRRDFSPRCSPSFFWPISSPSWKSFTSPSRMRMKERPSVPCRKISSPSWNSRNSKPLSTVSRSAEVRYRKSGAVRSVSFMMLWSSTCCSGPNNASKDSFDRVTQLTRVPAIQSAARGSFFNSARSPKYSASLYVRTCLSLTKQLTVPSLTMKKVSPSSPCLIIVCCGSYCTSIHSASILSSSLVLR
mmetsp:Transcript_58278/g.115671  ORF Transcript_58278/g.115671 Transcript_58278/m.115671 type:complete len:310 (-) Transcript_58278:391-1320(-)